MKHKDESKTSSPSQISNLGRECKTKKFSNAFVGIKALENFFVKSPFLMGIILGSYVFFLLILPLAALFILILKNDWHEIIQKATDPIAISAYSLTLQMAFFAAFSNTIFGFLITWVLTRYDFIGKNILMQLLIYHLPCPLP